jgi:hypothetical protein
VGAIVDHGTITTDHCMVEAAKTWGRHVEYITRSEACRLAALYASQEWLRLTVAATLYLTDGVSVFRPRVF